MSGITVGNEVIVAANAVVAKVASDYAFIAAFRPSFGAMVSHRTEVRSSAEWHGGT